MFFPDNHVEKDLKVLRKLIRENSLGLLNTGIQSSTHPFLQSSHIPFLLDIEDENSETELGRLRCHVARANPQAKAIIETLTENPQPNNVLEQEVLVVFTGAAQHYVTPKFYLETKPSTAKTVPTWNYAAVQVYGKARVYFDTKSQEMSDYLDRQTHDLSHFNETVTMGYTGGDKPEEWTVSEAPNSYVQLLKKAIIGIEIEVTRLEGKFKMSQEMKKGDRDGVVEGFAKLPSQRAQDVSQIVKERSEAKEKAKAEK